MAVSYYFKKIELLLERVFEGKISLCENNYNKEKLLYFFSDRNETSIGKTILDSPFFSDFIFKSLENINNNCTEVKIFLIEIVTILFQNELQFTKMQMHGYQKFSSDFCILGNFNNVTPYELHLACIKLATVQVTHCSGLTIIRANKTWKNILYPYIHHRPKPIADAAYYFMAKLVWKLNECNKEQELLEVLGHIVGPITASEYMNVQEVDNETDTEMCDKIFTHLSALLAVLTEADNHVSDNRVISLLKEYYLIDHALGHIFNGTKKHSLLKLLTSCFFRYNFGIHRHLLFSKQIDDFCHRMTVFHRNYLGCMIKKREAITIIDFIIQSNIIWSHFKKSRVAPDLDVPLRFEMNGLKYEYSLQIIVHLLMPMAKYSSLHRLSSNQVVMTDTIEQFLVKIGGTVTDYIYSSCYIFGALLEEACGTFRKKVTTHTLKELLRLNGHLTESQAGIIFQSLYYLLEIFILCDETGRLIEHEDLTDQDSLRLLSHLLEGIKMLLKEHNISWYENVEIVNIQTDLLNLLKQSFLTTKHVVQVLDLINICIKKFLSPNMSLLVESKSAGDSTLCEISKVIMLYSQHEEWEVRDSALTLLNSCTEISFIKYVPLQNMIKKPKLISLAAKSALTDPEFYSRCTALKCLTAAIKIENIWQEVLLDNENLYLQVIYLLRNHDHGMVRKEVVNVLTAVYMTQKLSQRFISTLYDIMLTAAIDDQYWEVQLAALNFWKSAIHNHLTYRGMLDGKFPPVTFSKEKRKIIVLNDAEIHRQLTGIMNHLSSIGCLTVLIECLNAIHNIDVMQQAYYTATELIEILDKYKFQKVTDIVKTEPADVAPKYMEHTSSSPFKSKTNEDERNKVIDSILSVHSSELIINLNDSHSQMKSEEMDIDISCSSFSRRRLVNANEFLEMFRNKDYPLIIENKKNCANCLSTLDELLDRFLGNNLK